MIRFFSNLGLEGPKIEKMAEKSWFWGCKAHFHDIYA